MPRRRLSVLALTLAACGGVAAAPVIANAAASTGDLALAKRISLRVSDFGAGWSGKPNSLDSNCFRAPVRVGSTALVESQRFSDASDRVEVSGMVTAYASPTAARRALTAVTGTAPIGCYRTALPAIFGQDGATMTRFVGARLPFGSLGDRVVASRYTVSVKRGATTGTISIDFIFVARGRFLVATGFVGEGIRPPVDGERTIIGRAIARVPQT